jgi:L-threonylcarbamoyladenylate synthase
MNSCNAEAKIAQVLEKSAPDSGEKAAAILLKGGIAVLPTDTIYGFSGLAGHCDEAIGRIKGREKNPFIRLIAEPDDIFRYTLAPIPSALLAHWPGPLTLVVPLKDGTSAAFRCPGGQWLRDVICRVGCPIISTSVNRTGQPPLTQSRAILEEFAAEIALLVVEDGENSGPVSTIYDIRAQKVLRQGALVLD